MCCSLSSLSSLRPLALQRAAVEQDSTLKRTKEKFVTGTRRTGPVGARPRLAARVRIRRQRSRTLTPRLLMHSERWRGRLALISSACCCSGLHRGVMQTNSHPKSRRSQIGCRSDVGSGLLILHGPKIGRLKPCNLGGAACVISETSGGAATPAHSRRQLHACVRVPSSVPHSFRRVLNPSHAHSTDEGARGRCGAWLSAGSFGGQRRVLHARSVMAFTVPPGRHDQSIAAISALLTCQVPCPLHGSLVRWSPYSPVHKNSTSSVMTSSSN